MPNEKLTRVAIFVYLHREGIEDLLQQLIHFFDEKEITAVLDSYLQDFILEKLNKSFKNCELILTDDFYADMAFSIGGDGTFLSTAARVGNKGIPVLGVNNGRLGFLADVAMEDLYDALNAVIENKFSIEERSLLHLQTMDGTRLETPYALNDIALQKQESSSMIIVEAKANGELINTYQSDGLIIATPTGSTAYSMSVGGPIMVPQAESFVISPVASHSLNVRPLIVPDTWVIELKVQSRTNNYLVSLDGRSKVLSQNTRLRIKKADYTIKLVKPKSHTFFNTLRNKLMWGADKRI
ncbi:putative inorganic polyphosphate/ATP-NAD kinase [uncultured Paludibacter sp.]|nr:putative inorganic polyphosphate/ATP-NAD kinase [uncultured Paludibacter sp.]